MSGKYCHFENGLVYEFPNEELYGFSFLQNHSSLIQDFILEDEYQSLDWESFEDYDLETTENLQEFIVWYNGIAAQYCTLEDFEPIPEKYQELFEIYAQTTDKYVFTFKIHKVNFLEYLQKRWSSIYEFPDFHELFYDFETQEEFLSQEDEDDSPMSGAGEPIQDDIHKYRFMCLLFAMAFTDNYITGKFTK
jgi:hypothetical protein